MWFALAICVGSEEFPRDLKQETSRTLIQQTREALKNDPTACLCLNELSRRFNLMVQHRQNPKPETKEQETSTDPITESKLQRNNQALQTALDKALKDKEATETKCNNLKKELSGKETTLIKRNTRIAALEAHQNDLADKDAENTRLGEIADRYHRLINTQTFKAKEAKIQRKLEKVRDILKASPADSAQKVLEECQFLYTWVFFHKEDSSLRKILEQEGPLILEVYEELKKWMNTSISKTIDQSRSTNEQERKSARNAMLIVLQYSKSHIEYAALRDILKYALLEDKEVELSCLILERMKTLGVNINYPFAHEDPNILNLRYEVIAQEVEALRVDKSLPIVPTTISPKSGPMVASLLHCVVSINLIEMIQPLLDLGKAIQKL